jgi:hypothetical protein
MAAPIAVVARETIEPVAHPIRLAARISVFSFRALVNVPAAALKYRAEILEEINRSRSAPGPSSSAPAPSR